MTYQSLHFCKKHNQSKSSPNLHFRIKTLPVKLAGSIENARSQQYIEKSLLIYFLPYKYKTFI